MSNSEDAIDRMVLGSFARAALQTQKDQMSPEFQQTLKDFTKTMQRLETELIAERAHTKMLQQDLNTTFNILCQYESYWWFKWLYPIQKWFNTYRAKKQLTIQKK